MDLKEFHKRSILSNIALLPRTAAIWCAGIKRLATTRCFRLDLTELSEALGGVISLATIIVIVITLPKLATTPSP